MKTTINFRPIFYSFVSLGLGIYFARLIFALNVYILLAVAISFAFLTFMCVKHKCIKQLVVIVASFVLGLGMFLLNVATFSAPNFVDGTYTVTGRISTVTNRSSLQSVVLDNVYINGERQKNDMVVTVTAGASMEEGYTISFTAYVEKTQLFTLGQFNNYYYKYSIAYTANTNEADVTITDYKGLNLAEKLRLYVKNLLFANMSNDNASISYASLFGDKTYVNDSIRDSFSMSGIAHLLAVSGLHIGFVTSLLLFLFNKTKLKKWANISIIGAILAFYCYLCSFSASVVRASIMFLVLSIAGLFGRQYDKLNSIGIAGIVVLLYKPLSVYDAGFLLSFGCVLSIFMFNGFFKRLFTKWRLPKKLADTFAVMFAVQLGILPLTIYYYGQVSILTLLANYICIPVFEVFFIMLFALTPIVLILPFLSILLKVPSIIIAFIIKVAQTIANQSWAVINLGSISPFALVGVYMALFILSQFVNLKPKQKLSTITAVLITTLVLALGITTPIANQNSITVLNAYGDNCYVLEFGGTTYVIGDFNKHVNQSLEKYSCNILHKTANYIFVTNNYELESNNQSIIYFSDSEQTNTLMFNITYKFGEVNVTSIKSTTGKCGVLISYKNFVALVADSELTYESLYETNQNVGKIDLLITSSSALTSTHDLNVNTFIVDGNNITSENNFTTKMKGNWTITFSDAKIDNIRSID